MTASMLGEMLKEIMNEQYTASSGRNWTHLAKISGLFLISSYLFLKLTSYYFQNFCMFIKVWTRINILEDKELSSDAAVKKCQISHSYKIY